MIVLIGCVNGTVTRGGGGGQRIQKFCGRHLSIAPKAATVLHNYLLEEMPLQEAQDDDNEEEDHLQDIDNLLPISNQPAQPPRGVAQGQRQRKALTDYYYSGDGQVGFQWERALGGSAQVDDDVN